VEWKLLPLQFGCWDYIHQNFKFCTFGGIGFSLFPCILGYLGWGLALIPGQREPKRVRGILLQNMASMEKQPLAQQTTNFSSSS
jgi:hypothetical protein